MPKKDETRTPKHVNVRLSYRDFLKLTEIAEIAAKIKANGDLRKSFARIVKDVDEDTSPEKFLGLVAGLPAKERTLERFHSQPPRAKPTRMYFTDPEPTTEAVMELHAATRKWTKGKLRHNQSKETCPTDVRVMFYAYVRGKELIVEGDPDITINKELRKWAPKTLAKSKKVARKDGTTVWNICSEIRGVEKEERPKRGKKKPVVETESEEERPKRKSKKPVVETESESESEEERPKRR